MEPNLQIGAGLPRPHAAQRHERLRLHAGHACSSTRPPRSARARPSVILLVYADAPAAAGGVGGRLLRQPLPPEGMIGLPNAYGFYGANPGYAMAARRHMHLFGTTSEQFGAIAVAQRQWALMNEKAQMRKPLTLEDHQTLALHRRAAPPVRLLPRVERRRRPRRDLTRAGPRPAPAARLRARRRPGAPGDNQRADREPLIYTGAKTSGEQALRTAGVTLGDIDVVELYDCYTYTVIVTLEDYGFCAKGEGGAFVEDGKLGPGGVAADQHRRRPALVVLHVGLHAAVRGRDPGPRPGRRSARCRSTTSCSSAATAATSTTTRRRSCRPTPPEPREDARWRTT